MTPRRAVIAAYLWLFVGPGVQLPYFSLYLDHLGLGGAEIGLIIGMQPLVRSLSGILSAAAADRFRMRHWLLVGMAAAGSLLFVPFLVAHHFLAVFVLMAGIAALHGPLIPTVDAVVTDHLTALGGDYARLRVWGSIAFVVGALLSAPLVERYSPSVVPWLLLLSALPLPLALARLPKEQIGHAAHTRAPWRLTTPTFRLFLLTTFLLQVSCGAWNGFFALHVRALGLSETTPGIAFALAVIVEIGLFLGGRRVLELIAPTRLVMVVIVFTVVRWALTSVVDGAPALIALQLGHAVTFSAFHLASVAIVTKLVPAHSSTGGMALYAMVLGVGGSLGLGLAGALIEPIGSPALFGVEAAVAALAIVPAWLLLRAAPVAASASRG